MRTMKCRKEGGRSLTVTMMGDTSYMMSTAARIPPECVNIGFGASVNRWDPGQTGCHQGAHLLMDLTQVRPHKYEFMWAMSGRIVASPLPSPRTPRHTSCAHRLPGWVRCIH